ncbi:MAG TPA: cytochrome c peroxidase, partial [Ramlibacter sp.]
EFEFGRSNGTDDLPWTIKTDGGAGFNADMRRISAAPQLATGPTDAGYSGTGTIEVWKISTGGGWGHPVHVHFEEGIILKRGGKAPPEWEKWARKDVYRIGAEPDSTSTVEFAVRFREFAGTYVEHCHNTQHEDTSMLLRWDLEFPGQVQVMPTPIPTWEGVGYEPSVALPTARPGLGSALEPVAPPPDYGLLGAVLQPEMADTIPLPQLSLKTVPVPAPAADALAEFVIDRTAAIELGKALFWDARVGSDSKTACASCHHSAGTDRRTKNQLTPGTLRRVPDTLLPNPDAGFDLGGPNSGIQPADFPLIRFLAGAGGNEPAQRTGSNEGVSSQGVFHGTFVSVTDSRKTKTAPADDCSYALDDLGFHYGAVNTRRVAPRNTPSVVNAVFNFRNFWDGRASNVFNGVDPFGGRNASAAAWKLDKEGVAQKVKVALPSSSLASQASGPPLSGVEMSCAQRAFIDLGRKLGGAPILAGQAIAPTDSVLGAYAGGRPTYEQLVKRAFNPAYWKATSVSIPAGDAPTVGSMDLNAAKPTTKPTKDQMVNLMDANFGLFFGIALQLYQSTLVADDSRFDQWAAGDAGKLNERERAGFEIFRTKGNCIGCHAGAELTAASFRNVRDVRLERITQRDGSTKTYDNGFYNIGVRPTHEDLGLGARGPFGHALGESMLLAEAADKEAAAAMLGDGFEPWKYILPTSPADVNVHGAFKTPGLRNVELTGPYFHDGGKATLMQVVDLYDRGGDFGVDNAPQLHPSIRPLGLTEQEKSDLVSFMLTLTDERVRMERA